MADFNLGGLLGGGGGLYDDLLTPQQQSQLSSRGLLAMAGAFADAGMPSRLPIPLGAAIGKAAAAMGTGRDQAALQVLQAQKLAQEVQTQKIQAALQQQMFNDFKSMPLAEFLKRHAGAAGGGVPAAAPSAAAAPAPGAPVASATDLPPGGVPAGWPGPNATILDSGGYGMPPRPKPLPWTGLTPSAPAAPPALSGPPTDAERQAWIQSRTQGGQDTIEDFVARFRAGGGTGKAPTGLLGPAPPLPVGDAPPPDAPGAGASLGGSGGLLSLASYNGGGAGTPPFGGAGQGGEVPGAGGDEVGSGGDAADAGRQARVDFWQSQGAPAHVAQGIADRVNAESGFKPGAMGDSNTSGGLYQHHADRLTRLQNFAAGQGKAWTDPNVQDQFAASEVRGGDAIATKHWPEIMAAPTRDAAATLWDQYFERSKYGPGAGGLPGGGSGGGAAPGAAGGAPATAAAGGGDGQGMNALLLELARRNAMAEILKLGNPYGSMLSVLQGSPEYRGQIAGAEAGARYPFESTLATWKAALDAANEEKKQKLTTLNTLTKTRVPDGKGGVVEVDATVAQAIDIAHGLPVPELGFKGMFSAGGAGATGGPVGTPIYTPQETARQQAAGGAPYATKDITLTWPDGETRKVTLTGEQAKDVAEGKPVPAIGWPGTTGGAGTAGGTPGAAGPASGGARVGEVVYPPGYDKATEVMLTQRRPKAEAAVQSLNFNETAQRLLDAGVITGWGAQLRLDVAKAKALFGWSNDKIANTEAFLSTQARQVAASLASGAFGSGSSITDNDRAYAAKMAGGDSNLDEASLRFLLRQNNTAARWEIDKYNADVKRHDPKGQLPILRVDEGPKAEAKPSGNQPTPLGGSQLNGKPYIKWSDGQWRPEGELPGQEK